MFQVTSLTLVIILFEVADNMLSSTNVLHIYTLWLHYCGCNTRHVVLHDDS